MAWLIILQAASITAVTVSLQMRFDGFRAGGCGARIKAIVPCALLLVLSGSKPVGHRRHLARSPRFSPRMSHLSMGIYSFFVFCQSRLK